LSDLGVPTGTFDLETPDKGTISSLGFLEIFIPIELLLDVGVDSHLIELDTFLGLNLLDGSQEGLRVEESVEESNLRKFGRLIFPCIELISLCLTLSNQELRPLMDGKASFSQVGGTLFKKIAFMRSSISPVRVSSPLKAKLMLKRSATIVSMRIFM